MVRPNDFTRSWTWNASVSLGSATATGVCGSSSGGDQAWVQRERG